MPGAGIPCGKDDGTQDTQVVPEPSCPAEGIPPVKKWHCFTIHSKPDPVRDDEMGKDIQKTGMISDMELTAEEMGRIKRGHWSIENRLHHVLDDTFREDRSPTKKTKNSLALLRKFAYNILRIAMLAGDCSGIMTEAMDDFSDAPHLREKYVFSGIASYY